MALLFLWFIADSTSLATCNNYRLNRKNDSYHLVIWHGQLWGNDFRCSRLKKARLAAGIAGAIRLKRVDIVWLWKVFGSVITAGSSQRVGIAPPCFSETEQIIPVEQPLERSDISATLVFYLTNKKH